MGAMSSYTAPQKYADNDTKVGWVKEAVQEGQAWLATSRSARDWDRSIDLIAGDDMMVDADDPKSEIKVNLTKRIIREQVSAVSNMRFVSSYRTDNSAFDDHAHVLNKLNDAWYVNTRADRALKKGYQWAAGLGTGYIGPVWDPHFHARQRGDIRLNVFGPRQVLPIQMPSDHDLQRSYAIVTVEEMPINLAKATFPKYAADIVPDRDSPNYLSKGLSKVQQWVSPFMRVGNTGRGKEDSANFPTVDVFNVYIADLTINVTDHEIAMGEYGTSWGYTVPFIGQEIPSGQRNAAGQTLYRKATEEDARLYPLLRRIRCSRTTVFYDDTSQWWHGMFPYVRLTFDEWPWDALGLSVSRDTGPIERSNNRILRAVDNSMNVRLAPPLQFDENVFSRGLMESIDLRAPNEEIAVNMSMGDAIKPILPADYYNFPANILQHLKDNEERAQWLTGTKDLSAMAKAGRIPSGDTLEKMMELAGPLAIDTARSMEDVVGQLGRMNLALFFQFYSLKRRIQIVGKDGTVEQDYDYDPGNMIPSHAAGEDPDKPSDQSMVQRAREHVSNFYYWINPKSQHQQTQWSRKLLMLQLVKLGFDKFPIDPWTIAKALEIEDEFGPPPDGTHTIMQRAQAWRHILREYAAEDQKMMAAASGGQGPGRPNSGHAPPQLKSKDGGTRTTMTTSK